jgi:hypothetical protein
MIIRDVLFVLGCAAGALLAISQYITRTIKPTARDAKALSVPA